MFTQSSHVVTTVERATATLDKDTAWLATGVAEERVEKQHRANTAAAAVVVVARRFGMVGRRRGEGGEVWGDVGR